MPPPSPECEQCVQYAAQGACESCLDQCLADQACALLMQCYGDCEWSGACLEKCNDLVPAGLKAMYPLMGCIVCELCESACASSSPSIFCK